MNETHLKTKTKWALGILLVLSLIIGMTVMVSAGSNAKIVESGTCGSGAKWELDSNGTLTIFGSGMTSDSFDGLSDKDKIKKVEVTSDISTIGDGLFLRCNNLEEVHVAKCVSSVGANAFDFCPQLKKVVLEEGVFEIGKNAFAHCANLSSVSLPDTLITIEDGAFSGCASLEKISLPDNLRTIGVAAFYQNGLKKIDLPNGITYLEGAFSGCEALEEVSLPDQLEAIGEATFMGCFALSNIELPSTLTSIGNKAFMACNKLENITIPENVTSLSSSPFPVKANVYFIGACPNFDSKSCENFSGRLYYPCGDKTWTAAKMQKYSGDPIWVKYHAYKDGICPVCGAIASCRIYGDNPYDTSCAIVEKMKEVLGVEKFDTMILASSTDFPDAISASYLAAKKHAPILLIDPEEDDANLIVKYLKKNLLSQGTLYVLGGENVFGEKMISLLDTTAKEQNSVMKQIAGADRYETNRLLLDEAGAPTDEIILCSGEDYVDAVSASATGKPILLVDNNTSNPMDSDPVNNYLKQHVSKDAKITIIGGTDSIKPYFEKYWKTMMGFKNVERLAGQNRYETSILVAKKFFDLSELKMVGLAWAEEFSDAFCGGPLAYAMDAPILLVDESINPDDYGFLPKEIRVIGFGGAGNKKGRLTDKTMHYFNPNKITEYKYQG